jgi:hypothetical protein
MRKRYKASFGIAGDASVNAVADLCLGWASSEAAKLKAGLSSKTVNNHLIVLRRMLGVAMEWWLLDRGTGGAVVEGAGAGVRLRHLRRGGQVGGGGARGVADHDRRRAQDGASPGRASRDPLE